MTRRSKCHAIDGRAAAQSRVGKKQRSPWPSRAIPPILSPSSAVAAASEEYMVENLHAGRHCICWRGVTRCKKHAGFHAFRLSARDMRTTEPVDDWAIRRPNIAICARGRRRAPQNGLVAIYQFEKPHEARPPLPSRRSCGLRLRYGDGRQCRNHRSTPDRRRPYAAHAHGAARAGVSRAGSNGRLRRSSGSRAALALRQRRKARRHLGFRSHRHDASPDQSTEYYRESVQMQ